MNNYTGPGGKELVNKAVYLVFITSYFVYIIARETDIMKNRTTFTKVLGNRR